MPNPGLTPLTPNPQLPQHPLGAYTDSLYEASRAQLEQEIQQRYADILQQLGYQDPVTRKFIRGDVELQADRTRTDLGHQLELAHQGVTDQSEREGTLFSGYRGTQTARAEHPFVQALSDLDIDVPKQLSALYEQAGGLINEYNTRNNLLLAEAAGRYDPSDPGSGHGNPLHSTTPTPAGPHGVQGPYFPTVLGRNGSYDFHFAHVLNQAFKRARNGTGGGLGGL